jgi:Fe-S-cluster containining protein
MTKPPKSLPIVEKTEKPWYSEGLNFACTGCGECCTGAPGYVWVTPEEIVAIAEHMSMSVEAFSSRYVRKVGDRFSLTENKRTYDCDFLTGKQCSIYPVRPVQCRTFPWWPQNLRSPEAWQQAATYCEGINREAPRVSNTEITTQCKNYIDSHPQDS